MRQHVLTMLGSMVVAWCEGDIEASARKHDATDDDMIHALRHHWRAFEADNPALTMFLGPSNQGDRWSPAS